VHNNGVLFAFAGLWDRWKDPSGQWIKSCSILTTIPNAVTSAVHDRMPVILDRDSYDLWLDPGLSEVAAISEMLKPYDARAMRCYPVSSRVNHVINDDAECSMPLPNAPEGHKCRRLHRHSFKIGIHVSGDVASPPGWVIDFGSISQAFAPLHTILDHTLLNEVDGLGNPTSENISIWIWDHLKPVLPGLSKVIVNETCTSGCVYEPSPQCCWRI
jgi:6-pyruvoyltetrahydropterin/6-carboxytetrahydropterin synthase